MERALRSILERPMRSIRLSVTLREVPRKKLPARMLVVLLAEVLAEVPMSVEFRAQIGALVVHEESAPGRAGGRGDRTA